MTILTYCFVRSHRVNRLSPLSRKVVLTHSGVSRAKLKFQGHKVRAVTGMSDHPKCCSVNKGQWHISDTRGSEM